MRSECCALWVLQDRPLAHGRCLGRSLVHLPTEALSLPGRHLDVRRSDIGDPAGRRIPGPGLRSELHDASHRTALVRHNGIGGILLPCLLAPPNDPLIEGSGPRRVARYQLVPEEIAAD